MTGIQDAHNLAWKLAEAVKRQGNEPTKLLQSYEAERKPVAIVSLYSNLFHHLLRKHLLLHMMLLPASSLWKSIEKEKEA